MYFLFSGEGATDLGEGRPGPVIAERADFLYGPMAILVDHIVESRHDYSLLEAACCGYLSEVHLTARGGELKATKKALRLPGPRRADVRRWRIAPEASIRLIPSRGSWNVSWENVHRENG
jgi:hypothetical protein